MANYNALIKSTSRVSDHGEVYTSHREVNAMLDLVKSETERIDSRFLEPACGNGNFLVEILKRKLNIITKKYRKSQIEFERYSVIAVSSIYGIDLLVDNIEECRERLLGIFTESYKRVFENSVKEECIRTIEFVLSKNIIQGDALTLTKVESEEPIVFSEWSAVNGSFIKRRDYTMANLLACQPIEEPNLFSDLGDKAFIPKPVAEYPLTHFLKISENV